MTPLIIILSGIFFAICCFVVLPWIMAIWMSGKIPNLYCQYLDWVWDVVNRK